MRRSIIPLALVAMLTGAFACAELSQSFKDWPSSPAGFLLTPSERKAYAELKTDAEAQAFIDLFWAKRDPDLNTVPNEFKLDFDQKVAAADKMFSTDKLPGSLSDRAKVLYLLGRPARIDRVPKGAEIGSRRAEEEHGEISVWTYQKEQLPATVKAKEVKFFFVESTSGAKDFVLDRFNPATGLANKVLAEIPELLIKNPKIKEVPRPGLIVGSKAATSSQAAVFDTQPRPWPEGAAMIAVQGFQSPVLLPIWVHMELPDSEPVASQAVGRVRKSDGGADVGSFAVAVTPITVAGGRGYQFSLPVEAGSYKVEIALLSETGPIAIGSTDITIASPPAEGTFFSPFYWGVDIRQEPARALGEAFNIGGWHVMPRPSGKLSPTDQLSYFCYVVRPGLDEQQKPSYQLALKLIVDDKPAGELPFGPVNLSSVGPDLWMFGNGLPLSNFTKAARYTFELTLMDTKTQAKSTGKLSFTIAPAAGQAATPAAAPKP